MTRIMYASGVVPMVARNAVVGLIEVADGRSRSALLYGYNSGLERVNDNVFSFISIPRLFVRVDNADNIRKK